MFLQAINFAESLLTGVLQMTNFNLLFINPLLHIAALYRMYPLPDNPAYQRVYRVSPNTAFRRIYRLLHNTAFPRSVF